MVIVTVEFLKQETEVLEHFGLHRIALLLFLRVKEVVLGKAKQLLSCFAFLTKG